HAGPVDATSGGEEHAGRREHSGELRNHHRHYFKLLGNLAGVQTAATAKGNQCKIARVVAALDRDCANRPLHVGVGHTDDSSSGVARPDLESSSEGFNSG